MSFFYKVVNFRILLQYGLKITFSTDTEAEIELVKRVALDYDATAAVFTDGWAQGGAGAVELADAVIEACKKESNFKFLYDLDLSIEEKINVIAGEMYGAASVVFSAKVKETIRTYTEKVKDTNVHQVI